MVNLSQLAEQLSLNIKGDLDTLQILGITEDSREVLPGYVFVAVPGLQNNGRDFIGDALTNGAVGVLMTLPDLDLKVPRILTTPEDLRKTMALLAAAIYDQPAEKLMTVAITGTNGKTTTSYLVEEILVQAGMCPGVMGTINYRWPGQVLAAPNTTAEGPVLFRCLADMHLAGAKSAVLEISSHSLSLNRVAGLNFDAALFTNLSRDHLDFHQDMEDYFQAKRRLFTGKFKTEGPSAVINIDDPYGQRLAQELGDKALTFGFSDQAEVNGSDLKMSRSGLTLTIKAGNEEWVQTSPLLAEINAYNLLGAIGLGLVLGFSSKIISQALSQAQGAPGRLEKVGDNSDYLVLVDYAHGPDALTQALKACRDLEPKRLLLVFGCGGDRDKGKRPEMAKIAGEMADMTIITSDNPRTEEPWVILEDVVRGIEGLGLTCYNAGELTPDWTTRCYLKIIDRRAAIKEAVNLMEPGDLLLIAGKGHEDYQIIGRQKRHLDDRQEALAALKNAGYQK